MCESAKQNESRPRGDNRKLDRLCFVIKLPPPPSSSPARLRSLPQGTVTNLNCSWPLSLPSPSSPLVVLLLIAFIFKAIRFLLALLNALFYAEALPQNPLALKDRIFCSEGRPIPQLFGKGETTNETRKKQGKKKDGDKC